MTRPDRYGSSLQPEVGEDLAADPEYRYVAWAPGVRCAAHSRTAARELCRRRHTLYHLGVLEAGSVTVPGSLAIPGEVALGRYTFAAWAQLSPGPWRVVTWLTRTPQPLTRPQHDFGRARGCSFLVAGALVADRDLKPGELEDEHARAKNLAYLRRMLAAADLLVLAFDPTLEPRAAPLRPLIATLPWLPAHTVPGASPPQPGGPRPGETQCQLPISRSHARAPETASPAATRR